MLLPERPNSALIASNDRMSSFALSTTAGALSNNLDLTRSVLRTPNSFSNARMTLYSASVKRASIFFVRFSFFMEDRSCERSDTPLILGGGTQLRFKARGRGGKNNGYGVLSDNGTSCKDKNQKVSRYKVPGYKFNFPFLAYRYSHCNAGNDVSSRWPGVPPF